MCRDMEEIYGEGLEKGEQIGFERGAEKRAREIVISMAKEEIELETISRLTKVDINEVRKWTDEIMLVM